MLTALYIPTLDYFTDSFVIISQSGENISLAIFIEGSLFNLREFSLNNRTSTEVLPHLVAKMFQAERITRKEISNIILIAPDDFPALFFTQNKNWKIVRLDMSMYTDDKGEFAHDPNELGWALCLATWEAFPLRQKPKNIFNFRKEEFKYNACMDQTLLAFKKESKYFILFFALLIAWMFANWYKYDRRLSRIDHHINKAVSEVLPGEHISPRSENAMLSDKITFYEESLRDLGSLSELSPLDTLKRLSSSIPNSIDLVVRRLMIGNARMSIKGKCGEFTTIRRIAKGATRNNWILQSRLRY